MSIAIGKMMRAVPEAMHPERDLNPPNDKREFTPDQLQAARDEIIETVLAFGQWPQPLRSRKYVSAIPKEFDLLDFLKEKIEHTEAIEFMVLALSDHGICGQFASKRDAWEKKVTGWLVTFFDDTDRGRQMVEDHCEEIERAEREDH